MTENSQPKAKSNTAKRSRFYVLVTGKLGQSYTRKEALILGGFIEEVCHTAGIHAVPINSDTRSADWSDIYGDPCADAYHDAKMKMYKREMKERRKVFDEAIKKIEGGEKA